MLVYLMMPLLIILCGCNRAVLISQMKRLNSLVELNNIMISLCSETIVIAYKSVFHFRFFE